DVRELLQRQEPGAQAVVDIVVVVGDLVRDVRNLRLEPRLAPLDEAAAHVAELAGVAQRAVLQDAFPRLERKVQARERGVALLELVDDAQRLQVVLEAAELVHARVQLVLPGMPERRVAEIVREAHGLDEILVEAHRPGDRAGDLSHLERMREARAVVVAFVVDEDLGLVDEAAEGRGVDDAVAVALELVAIGGGRLGISPAARFGVVGGVRGERALPRARGRRWHAGLLLRSERSAPATRSGGCGSRTRY